MEPSKLDFEPNQELFAVYNSLGHLQDGTYFKEPDCSACLKDLLRFMRTENQHTFATRRQLGNCRFVSTDLAPLVKQHCLNDNTLFDYVLRLLTSLTTPPILLFKEQVPEEKETRKIYLDLQQHVFNYKVDLSTDVMFWSVIAKQMLRILKMEQDKREEEDKVMLERMLILTRNVLHVASQDEEDVIAGEDNVHDKLLISMKKAYIYDILIYVCQTASEHDLAFHILEILHLMYREQNAEHLATLTDSLRLSEAEKRKDIEHLKELKARTRSNRSHQDKYNRFKESTYVVKNLKSIGNNDMICHRPVADISELNLDQNKKIVRKAKNRRHFQDQSLANPHSSSLELKSYLRDLAITFISSSYNLLMKDVRYYLERSKSQENDETYFIWAAYFFMEFNRCSEATVDFVTETLSREYLHYLHCQVESCLDHMKTDKKNTKNWSKRLHNGLRAYKELIYMLAHLQSKKNCSAESLATAEDLRRKLFYEEDYRELLRMLITVFDPIKMSDAYLNDLIESNHLFLKMLEYHCKKNANNVVIRKKKRKQKNRKSKKNKEAEEQAPDEQPELIWTELAAELSNVLQSGTELPRIEENLDLNVFSVMSEESRDDQKLTVMKKINLLLFTKRAEEAVAVFREARNFFNDDSENTFGAFDIPLDEELLALQNVLMNEFLLDCNRDELRKLKRKDVDPAEENDEDELADEEEEEADDEPTYKEQVFDFNQFVKSFASQKILQPYCLAFQRYETNSVHVNSCIIKMFHRLAFDCMMYCMFFQLSFFRTMQNIFNDNYDNPFYGELVRFNKFVVSKFVGVVKNNPNVFIEMLYSKSSKEAYIVEHGHEEVKVKEPARKRQKKGKTTELEEEFIDDKNDSAREEEEEPKTAAEKYDKLFGNKKEKRKTRKSVLESTRIESDLESGNELVIDDSRSGVEAEQSAAGDQSETVDQSVPVVDSQLSTSLVSEEVVQKRKERRQRLLALIKEQNSQEEAKSRKRPRKRRVAKLDDSENEQEAEKSRDETADQIEDKAPGSESSETKPATRRPARIFDSDESDREDKADGKSKEKSDGRYARIESDDDADKSGDAKETRKSDEANKDEDSDEELFKPRSSGKKSLKRKLINSDSEEDSGEKENLSLKSNNLEGSQENVA